MLNKNYLLYETLYLCKNKAKINIDSCFSNALIFFIYCKECNNALSFISPNASQLAKCSDNKRIRKILFETDKKRFQSVSGL